MDYSDLVRQQAPPESPDASSASPTEPRTDRKLDAAEAKARCKKPTVAELHFQGDQMSLRKNRPISSQNIF
jgi:hypothetical protein